MAPKPVAIVRVRAIRGVYSLDQKPDGTWSKAPTAKGVGSTFVMRLKDAIEARSTGKVEILGEATEPAKQFEAPARKAEK